MCSALETDGIDCYLPQRDTNQNANRLEIFQQNSLALKKARTLLAVANNESPNWGAEVGLAQGKGKWVVILTSEDHPVPLMAEFLANEIVRVNVLDDIPSYIMQLIAALK